MPANSPEQMHQIFQQAFNAGDLDGLMALYEDDAAFVPEPGAIVSGKGQIRDALQGFLSVKGQITLDTKMVVYSGDLALAAGRWSLTGTGPDGSRLEMGGQTAEVIRRQSDGSWLYVIDNPWGDHMVKA